MPRENIICSLEDCNICNRPEHWAKYRMLKYECGWCGYDLYQTEALYLLKGNICAKCTTRFANIMSEIKEQRERLNDIKKYPHLFQEEKLLDNN